MSDRSVLTRLKWPLVVLGAIIVTSVIQPDVTAVIILGGLALLAYLSWSRTRLLRTAWPRVASLGFSVVVLGLALFLSATTAVSALQVVGLIDRPAEREVAEASPIPTATPSTTPSPTPDPTPSPTLRSPTPSPTPTPVPTPVPGSEPTGPTTVATVVSVTDGDTIRVLIDGAEYPVRYIGIDTPETVEPGSPVEWMGPEASAANAALVSGRTVVLEKDVSETDDLGRLLRYVWLEEAAGWVMVNHELVLQGYATAVSYPPDVKYQDLLRAAMREANESDVGLWGPTPTPSPTPAPTPVPFVPQPPPAPAPPAPGPGCHPSYSNVCLGIGIGDYDCAGGSGNGPNYVVGPVYLVGYDEFGLDGNDNDGIGCE